MMPHRKSLILFCWTTKRFIERQNDVSSQTIILMAFKCSKIWIFKGNFPLIVCHLKYSFLFEYDSCASSDTSLTFPEQQKWERLTHRNQELSHLIWNCCDAWSHSFYSLCLFCAISVASMALTNTNSTHFCHFRRSPRQVNISILHIWNGGEFKSAQ